MKELIKECVDPTNQQLLKFNAAFMEYTGCSISHFKAFSVKSVNTRPVTWIKNQFVLVKCPDTFTHTLYRR